MAGVCDLSSDAIIEQRATEVLVLIIDQPQGSPFALKSIAIKSTIEVYQSAISRHGQGKMADAIDIRPLEPADDIGPSLCLKEILLQIKNGPSPSQAERIIESQNRGKAHC